jgi:hypothetical protein
MWFLVEHPGPWGRVPLSGSGLDGAAAAAIGAWAQRERGRILLIRRPGRRERGERPMRWYRVDSRPGRETVRGGTFRAERELVDVVADAGAGEAVGGPLYAVCTHGRHDTCCAVSGRPVAAALAGVAPERTWECSHVGGCRFAAALILLPHGFVLGAVPPDAAPEVARSYAEGRLLPGYVRGRCTLAPAEQAAQHHARLRTGAVGVDALRPLAARSDGAGNWRVELADPDCTVVLRERVVELERPLTCAATAPGRMRVFDLVDLDVAAQAVPLGVGARNPADQGADVVSGSPRATSAP